MAASWLHQLFLSALLILIASSSVVPRCSSAGLYPIGHLSKPILCDIDEFNGTLIKGCYGFNPIRHSPRPVVFDMDMFKDTHIIKSFIAVDQHAITAALAKANTPGFTIASAILQNERLFNSLLREVFEAYKEQNDTKLFIPNCDAITFYIRHLENEMQILENNPGIIDHIISGARDVAMKLVKTVIRYDGGGTVNVSHPFIYSSVQEGGAVAVHGAPKGEFGALESMQWIGTFGDEHERVVFDGDSGLREGVESMWATIDNEKIKKMGMKIEVVTVTNTVPSEEANQMPFATTVLHTLHF